MTESAETLFRSGFWERRESRYPLPMSRHLWDLMTPLFREGTRLAFERYGCALEYFDSVRFKGRRYLRAHIVDTPEKLRQRQLAAERVWNAKLWRLDCALWPAVRNDLRRRLVEFARQNPQDMRIQQLHETIVELRKLLREGTIQHFTQQPASMVPVGDWVRRTRALTGAPISEIIGVLQNCRSGLADCVHMIDQIVETIRGNPSIVELVRDHRLDPAVRLERLRHASTSVAQHLDAYLEEYGDRIVTGFDFFDATLRELPVCTLSLIESRLDSLKEKNPNGEYAHLAESRLRDLLPYAARAEFDEGLAEAKTAYGLHDEDVRITYLWPLGLMRRGILAAAERLVSRGALHAVDDVFQTTQEELDALMTGASTPGADEISERADDWRSWRNEEPPRTFGERPPLPSSELLGPACTRVTSAIMFYLSEMEGRERYPLQPSASLMLQGLAASPGCYEGRARIVRSPADLTRLSVGDVLVARTASPAYNVILPSVGAVVTDRGGTLCHAAIIAREFSVPAVVGLDQATLRIPDGARVLVDGDRGLVAIRG